LTLKDPDGNVIDILVTINLLDDQAYGRKTDGSSELVLLKPTPGTANIYDPSLYLFQNLFFLIREVFIPGRLSWSLPQMSPELRFTIPRTVLTLCRGNREPLSILPALI